MNKLSVEGSRNSIGLGRPPPSPGAKRHSQLDPVFLNSMFPDAVGAISRQKQLFTQRHGFEPASNRNSMITLGDRSSMVIDRSSFIAPGSGYSAADENKRDSVAQAQSPWTQRAAEAQRPKSSSSTAQASQHAPMGQFSQPPPSAGLRSPRPTQLSGDTNLQHTTLTAASLDPNSLPMLSPYHPSGSWASQMATPMVPNFNTAQAAQQQADIASATAMKLAALSTVQNRIQLDDVRKYRRTKANDQGQQYQNGMVPPSPGMPPSQVIMTADGQVLTPQQAAALQAHQMAAMRSVAGRSRPSSPGLMVTGAPGLGALGFHSPQNAQFLTAPGGLGAIGSTGVIMDPMQSLAAGLASPMQLGFGLPGMGMSSGSMGGDMSGYGSDHDPHHRGRSPRPGAKRGSSKPPEDPTDLTLLKDIPAWLRSLRLHKYTDCLKDLRWQDLVELDDDGLEKRGVAAQGARRKMLKVSCLLVLF
jgi:SAM domain (Sterile alpha motif)